jgi:hypothetical protein
MGAIHLAASQQVTRKSYKSHESYTWNNVYKGYVLHMRCKVCAGNNTCAYICMAGKL